MTKRQVKTLQALPMLISSVSDRQFQRFRAHCLLSVVGLGDHFNRLIGTRYGNKKREPRMRKSGGFGG